MFFQPCRQVVSDATQADLTTLGDWRPVYAGANVIPCRYFWKFYAIRSYQSKDMMEQQRSSFYETRRTL